MDKQSFGKYIAEKRKQLGMTQMQLAEKLHVTDKAVSKWERGLSYPDVTLLEPLAEELSVSIGELLSCRVPAAEEREQPMTEEKRKETVQTDESLQAVVEISKDTVQQKRRDIRRLITALVVVVAAALIVLGVEFSRRWQENRHFITVKDAEIEALYSYRGHTDDYDWALVFWEGQYLRLQRLEESWSQDAGAADLIDGNRIAWRTIQADFTYDDRTNKGKITELKSEVYHEKYVYAGEGKPTELPLFGLEETFVTQGENGDLFFYREVEGEWSGQPVAEILLRMPSYYLTNGYGIVDLGKDGEYDLLADDGIRENTQVIYTYSDAGAVSCALHGAAFYPEVQGADANGQRSAGVHRARYQKRQRLPPRRKRRQNLFHHGNVVT